MTRRVLDGLGLIALLLFVGGGVAAWLLVKQQVHVTFQEGSVARADDPVALLRDEVRQQGLELARLREALARSLEKSFASLADAQATEDRERLAAGELQRGAERERAERALAAAEARILARLAVLQEQLAAVAALAPAAPAEGAPSLAAASQPTSQATPPPSDLAAAARPGAERLGQSGAPATEPPAPLAQSAPQRRRGSFLAFDLASDEFRFAGPQVFEIVPSLSRVGFDGKSTLHDFTGATTDVGGELRADLEAPAGSAGGRIWARARALDTGLADRNDAMREHLDTQHHERIEFAIEGFATKAVDTAAMTVKGTVTGTMTIRGKSRRFAMAVAARVDESRRLCVDGSAPLKPSEFGIEVPSKLGIVKFTDDVVVWVALKLRVKRT